jgi:hypothetical protein
LRAGLGSVGVATLGGAGAGFGATLGKDVYNVGLLGREWSSGSEYLLSTGFGAATGAVFGLGSRGAGWVRRQLDFSDLADDVQAGVRGFSASFRSRAAGRGVVRGRPLSAAEANASHVAAGRRPPYAAGSRARDIVLDRPREFVRVHGEGNQARSWLMRREEIEGLTAVQIRDRFALPELPSYVSDVHVPAGTRLRVGTVGKQPGWGGGGATQYELLERLPPSAFTNQRPLS